MSRLGIFVDVSHTSKQAMMQATELSAAPIMASHSGVSGLADVSRTLVDEQLQALKKMGHHPSLKRRTVGLFWSGQRGPPVQAVLMHG